MIINLHFNKFRQNRFVPDGPYIMLDKYIPYEITVKQIHIELQSNQISKDNELWCLSTNLVDRSTANPMQAVSYFSLTRGKLNYSITQMPVAFYPLEVHQLENTEFLLQRVDKEKKLKIENAFVQLEIRKCLELARA